MAKACLSLSLARSLSLMLSLSLSLSLCLSLSLSLPSLHGPHLLFCMCVSRCVLSEDPDSAPQEQQQQQQPQEDRERHTQVPTGEEQQEQKDAPPLQPLLVSGFSSLDPTCFSLSAPSSVSPDAAVPVSVS